MSDYSSIYQPCTPASQVAWSQLHCRASTVSAIVLQADAPAVRICVRLQVDAFLMPPACSGAGEAKRRATLLSRRTEWRALGIPEELHPQSMTDEELM